MRTCVACVLSAIAITIACGVHYAYGFQIAPLSSKEEEKFTKEPTSNRARVAGKLGRLIKGPVHEEIAQLAMGCGTADKDLPTDTWCASADRGYGPKSCSAYRAGPTRKVPGRQGMRWEEEDWVDDEATAHRRADD